MITDEPSLYDVASDLTAARGDDPEANHPVVGQDRIADAHLIREQGIGRRRTLR